MLGSLPALHAAAVTSLVLQGAKDCVLVSSCGGRLGIQSLLLALHSPLLASLLGQGEGGISLPLPLPAIKAMVSFLQSQGEQEEGKHLSPGVQEEVEEGLALLGISVYIADIKPELPTSWRCPGGAKIWMDQEEGEPIKNVPPDLLGSVGIDSTSRSMEMAMMPTV